MKWKWQWQRVTAERQREDRWNEKMDISNIFKKPRGHILLKEVSSFVYKKECRQKERNPFPISRGDDATICFGPESEKTHLCVTKGQRLLRLPTN